MTTTMLSSKPKSDKRLFDSRFWGLYKTTVRQNLLAVILYTVCLMLVTVLPTYSQSYNSTPTTAYDHYLLSSSYGFGFVGLIVPVLVAAVVFHYLHDRLSVDFYHSMPVSRTKLFFAKYCAGLDMLLAPVCLAKLLCILCHLAFYSGVFSTGHILYVGALDFLFYMIMYTAVYTLSCLVAVTSSTVVETVLYSAALNGAPTVLWLILVNIGNDLYGVRIDSYLLNDISPYETIITFIDNFSYADSFPVFMLKAPLMWLAISVAALFLCVHMYKRFHSEWAQMWGRQSVFAQIMKTLAGILVAFILSLTVMASLTDSITTRYVLSALIGAPLGFLLVEGATGKGFMNLGKNLKYIALTTVVCLCAPLFIATDGFGMVSRVPSIDSVKEISLNPPMAWTNYNQYLYTRGSRKAFLCTSLLWPYT